MYYNIRNWMCTNFNILSKKHKKYTHNVFYVLFCIYLKKKDFNKNKHAVGTFRGFRTFRYFKKCKSQITFTNFNQYKQIVDT